MMQMLKSSHTASSILPSLLFYLLSFQPKAILFPEWHASPQHLSEATDKAIIAANPPVHVAQLTFVENLMKQKG